MGVHSIPGAQVRDWAFQKKLLKSDLATQFCALSCERNQLIHASKQALAAHVEKLVAGGVVALYKRKHSLACALLVDAGHLLQNVR